MTSRLQLTTLGHSCVLIEATGEDGTLTRILLDPGTLTPELDPIRGLDAILVTHAHPDHIDPAQVRRVIGDTAVAVYGDAATSRVLEEGGLPAALALAPGPATIAGVAVEVSEWPHEAIYPGVPVPVDYGYLIAGRIFAPGDAFAVPEFPVEVLLLPTGAPWMKLSEAIDYMRAVAPRLVIPVHDGGLAMAHREMHRNMMNRFAPEGTDVRRPTVGETVEVS